MELIKKRAAETDESAAVPDEGLIAVLSPSHATHLLLTVCVWEKKKKETKRKWCVQQSDREHKFDLVRVCAYVHLKTGARVAGELCVRVCLCVCHARQSSLVILNGASRDWALSENPVVFRKPTGSEMPLIMRGPAPQDFL